MRLNELKSFCESIAAINSDFHLDNQKWEMLPQIISILKLAADKMIMLQKRDLPLSEMYGAWFDLELSLDEINDSLLAAEMAKCLRVRSKELRKNIVLISCIYLDPRYQLILEEDEKAKAVDHLASLYNRMNPAMMSNVQGLMNSDDVTENASNVSRFLKNKAVTSGRAVVQSTANIRLKLIEFGSVDILDEKESIVDFWTNHKRRYPEIFHLSEIVFAVPSTEVEVQPIFKVQFCFD